MASKGMKKRIDNTADVTRRRITQAQENLQRLGNEAEPEDEEWVVRAEANHSEAMDFWNMANVLNLSDSAIRAHGFESFTYRIV